MADAELGLDVDATEHDVETWVPSEKEQASVQEVIKTFEKGREVLNKGYNYFQGASLYDVIDDWTKRWNGYIPPLSPLLDQTSSNIFINFTRNAIISYLAKVAMSPVKARIVAVNKKSGHIDQQYADVLSDLNTYSLNAENAEKKFLQTAMECCVKGTVIVYEGYMKQETEMETPDKFDAVTGEITYKKETRVLFDNCFQRTIALEDFFITNPFQQDVQKQPKIIWREITDFAECKKEFEHYKNFEYVKPGKYSIANEVSTFYHDSVMTTLGAEQVEILRYYCKSKNNHKVLINGIPVYDGPIPFKDGNYPFAKTVNEPFANDFFWGNGHPNKYMGEQDLINTFINAMADKNMQSLTTTGITSDLDDLIEDDVLEVGKWRKVADIEKWKLLPTAEVTSAEMNMFNQVMTLARESGNTDAGSATTPRGGKMQTRQILLKQQEVMAKLSFNMTFLEDLERDRTELRLAHILQFYSIPKIEKITGRDKTEIEKITYRDVHMPDTKLSDGRTGNKIIKLIGDEHKTADGRAKLEDDLSVMEMEGELRGVPTEVLALSVDSFRDFDNRVQVIKYSSYEKNQAIDQAARMEFANWRFQMQQVVPIKNPQGLIDYVEEAFDIDTDQFESAPAGQDQQQQMPQMPQIPGQNAGGNGQPQVLQQNGPSAIGSEALSQM